MVRGALRPEITGHPAKVYKGLKLKLVTNDDTLINCDGCTKRIGTTTRYKVDGTKSRHLHICCADTPELNDFKFLPELPKTNSGERRLCGKDSCRKGVYNFAYYDSSKKVYYHACCANKSCECTPATAQNSKPDPIGKYRSLPKTG